MLAGAEDLENLFYCHSKFFFGALPEKTNVIG